MGINGAQADGLLPPEEIEVSGPLLVLRLVEKGVNACERGAVVVAGEQARGGAVLRRLLRRHEA